VATMDNATRVDVAGQLLEIGANLERAATLLMLEPVDIRGIKTLLTESGRLLERAYKSVSAAGYRADRPE